MRPVIFSELREFVAAAFPADAEDALMLMNRCGDGAAIENLVGELKVVSATVGLPMGELLKQFGAYLFVRFASLFPTLPSGSRSALAVLNDFEDTVHGEVRWLNPEAELPQIESRQIGPNRVEIHYKSSRPLALMFEGLIQGCISLYGEKLAVRCTFIAPDHTEAVFMVGKASRPQRPTVPQPNPSALPPSSSRPRSGPA